MAERTQPPQHKDPTRRDRIAVAPYNFVPITNRVVAFREDDLQLPEPNEDRKPHPLAINHSEYHVRKYSGWIDVALVTKTPVYVRAPLTQAEFGKTEQEKETKTNIEQLRNKPEFFHTGDSDRPVIPGSSLRGMIRSMVEIVAHGKLSPVTDNHLIYRAVGDTSSHGDAYREQLFESDNTRHNYFTPRFKGGYMGCTPNGEWYIQPAQEVSGTTFARISHKLIPHNLKRWGQSKNASEIYVAINDYDYKPVRGGFVHMKRAQVVEANSIPKQSLIKAAMSQSGRIPKKTSEIVIFDVDESAEPIIIPNDSDSPDGDMIAAYRDQISPEQKEILGNRGVFVVDQPVLYLMEGDKLVFFGHTQMFRIPYRFSPRDMLPWEHCANALVDFAELMFGRVKRQRDQEGLQAIAGRVFVGEATTEEINPWLPGNAIIVPKILASPKPTTFQHYLTQSRPDIESGKGLETYNSTPRHTTLRGHKLYWHKGGLQRDEYEADPGDIKGKESQYTRIKPVREGVRFTFRIRFENLAAVELGALWWAIALPTQGDFYHKIGMAKPLGLGSVKLTPALHLCDPQVRYEELFADNQFCTGEVPESVSIEIRQQSITLFENLICRQLGYTDFTKSARIQMLLEMLRWPGPQPYQEKTRYMEIEFHDPTAKRGKRNEYRDRPVLPTPVDVK